MCRSTSGPFDTCLLICVLRILVANMKATPTATKWRPSTPRTPHPAFTPCRRLADGDETGDSSTHLSFFRWSVLSFDHSSVSSNTPRGKRLIRSTTGASCLLSLNPYYSYQGYLREHEAYFYLLDALPMLFPLATWVAIWAPQYIGKNPKSFTLADEMAQAHSRFSDQSVGDITKKY